MASTRLKYAQVSAAHVLHENGWSLNRIAAEIYGRYGYASQASCHNALRRCMKIYGFQYRSRTERLPNPTCSACGIDHEERNSGCPRCAYRHQNRARRGQPHVSALATTCKACGCKLDERTRGCAICSRRHWKRDCDGSVKRKLKKRKPTA